LRTVGMCSAKCAVLADPNIRLSLSKEEMKRDVQTVPGLFTRNWSAIYQLGEKIYVGRVFEWSQIFLLCKLLRQ
jgi:hypothetical protein